MTNTPIVNTHVHFPPNFSAYATVAEAVEAGRAQQVAAIGISNFYDQSVYELFRDQAAQAGITPLYGLEFITLVPELAEQGVRVNDPSNPGRMYLCGKGINPFKVKSARAQEIADKIRTGNDERAAAMVNQLAAWCAENGLDTGLTPESIAEAVADRAGVPAQWVSLQERHIASAFQQVISALPELERHGILTRLYGGIEPTVDLEDAAALQGEIRTRLLKTGTPGFAPEVPLSFDEAYEYILEMDGIPVYPTLADGTNPICPFEDPAPELAQRLRARGIQMAELIPIRNTSACVDRYVRAFTEAGLLVIAGTEHNTPEQIPLEPACVDGPVSDYARQAFFDSACVIAAHQHLVSQGRPGYVDRTGRVVGDPVELARLGARLLARDEAAERLILTRVAPALRGALAQGDRLPVVTSSTAPAVRAAEAEELAAAGALVLELDPTQDLVEQTLAQLGQERPTIVALPGQLALAAGSDLATASARMQQFLQRLTTGSETEIEPTEAADATPDTSGAGRLAGKVVVVTGAAQGFGLGIAQELITQGASLVLADLNVAQAQQEADRLCAEHGAGRAVALAVNVSDEHSTKRFVAEVCRLFGGIDVFVSNAGVLRAGSVLDQPVGEFDLVTSVNYRGYFLCVQAAAPIMAVQNRVRPDLWFDIVEINSKSGLEGSKRNFAYAGSKFGGIGLTQSFALELVEHGIKVNAICPGNYLDGPLWMDPERGLFVQYLAAGKVPGATTVDEVRAFYEAKVPMNRGCVPADLAKAIYYIVDQDYETGQAVPVTGGQNMLN